MKLLKAVKLDNLPKWDQQYYALAQHVAQWSKDPRTQVGAVVVGNNPGQVSLGYNGFPRGVKDLPERLENREVKNYLIQHAERNALDNSFFVVQRGTLYVTQIPCSSCTRSIIQKGIQRVVCPPPPNYEPWQTDSQWSILMMSESQVDLVLIEEKAKYA